MALATLSIDLVAKVAQFEQQLKQTTAVVEGQAKAMAGAIGVVETSLKSLGLAAVAGLSFGALKDKISGVVSAAADLQQLSERTGATVEELSGLASVARLSNTENEALAAGLQKLSKSMVAVKDDGSETAKAFAAIGISAADLRDKSPAAALQLIAERLTGYRDGAEKTAIAQALMGKSGANLLPLLKDLADAGALQAKVTAEQAQMADEYEKNLVRLNAAQSAAFKTLAMELLPVMNDVAQVMLDSARQTNVLKGAVGDLATDHSLRDWAQDGAVALVSVFEVVKTLIGGIRALGGSVEVVLSDLRVAAAQGASIMLGSLDSGVLAGGRVGQVQAEVNAELKRALADRERILTDANKRYADLWNKDATTLSTAMRQRFNLSNLGLDASGRAGASTDPRSLGVGGGLEKAVINFGGATEKQAKAAKEGIDEAARALATYVQGLERSIESTLHLTEEQKALNFLMGLGTKGEIPQVRELVLELARRIDKEKELVEVLKLKREAAAAPGDEINVRNTRFQALLDATPSARLAQQRQQMRELADAFQEGAFGNPESIEAAQKYGEVVNTVLGNVGEAVSDLDRQWQSVGDNFARGLEDAIVAGKSLTEVMGNLGEQILRIAVRETITAPIGNAISSAFQGFSFASLFGFADGGVMTPMGPMPLRTYAQGGVASSPQAAIFGEGSMPEAYVPLPDGRRIPVALQGASGGGRPIVVNISNTIGSVASQSDVVLGMRTVRAQIIGELSRQQRLGGGFA